MLAIASREEFPPQRLARARFGFTLLELLVVVAVLALLIVIGGVALRGSAESTVSAANLARLRQHSAIIQLYSLDYNQRFPLIMRPGQPWEFVRFGRFTIRTDYFGAFFAWQYALAPRYYDDDPHSAVFRRVSSVGDRDARAGQTDFWYSNSFLADPRFWARETRTGPEQWRATRQEEVRFPSAKVLFYTDIPGQTWSPDIQRPLGFCDGSARVVHASQMRPAYRNANGNWPGSTLMGRGIPGMHTVDGVHGRDID